MIIYDILGIIKAAYPLAVAPKSRLCSGLNDRPMINNVMVADLSSVDSNEVNGHHKTGKRPLSVVDKNQLSNISVEHQSVIDKVTETGYQEPQSLYLLILRTLDHSSKQERKRNKVHAAIVNVKQLS